MKSISENGKRHGSNTKQRSHIFKFLHITQLSYKRMFHFYRASAIKVHSESWTLPHPRVNKQSNTHFHRETMGLEGGVSSLGGKGWNYGWGVVKFLGMIKFQWANSVVVQINLPPRSCRFPMNLVLRESARLPQEQCLIDFWGATAIFLNRNREIAAGWAVGVWSWWKRAQICAVLEPTPNAHRLPLLSHLLRSA